MDHRQYANIRLQLWREPEIILLGRLIFGEARGETISERIAVAHTVRNRSLRGGWWGKTVKEVCLARSQFSCFNADDPNLLELMNVQMDDPVFLHCVGVAGVVLQNSLPDPTGGATHYHSGEVTPYWADSMECTLQTKKFRFFREREDKVYFV